MASSLVLWLRDRGDTLVERCAAILRRRRWHAATAHLPPRVRENAALWRALYLARNARLQREREARETRRGSRVPQAGLRPPQDISKADVLAAIARSRADREARLKAARERRGPG